MKRTHTNRVMNVSTVKEEDISAASFPQSHRNFSPTGILVQRASGELRPVFSITETSLNYANFPYENCIKSLHMRDQTSRLIAAVILATPSFFFTIASFNLLHD